MTGVLAPLTEILTTLPMGLPNDGDGSPGEQTRARCAGAGFELSPTPAPMPGPGAPRLVHDALLALAGDAERLATGDRRLDAVGASIRAAADRLGGSGTGSGTGSGSGSGTGTDGADGRRRSASVWRMTAPPCRSLADTGRVMDDRRTRRRRPVVTGVDR